MYDAVSGQLVGAARSDDVPSTFPGTSCEAATFVGGLIPVPVCDDATVVYCRRLSSQSA